MDDLHQIIRSGILPTGFIIDNSHILKFNTIIKRDDDLSLTHLCHLLRIPENTENVRHLRKEVARIIQKSRKLGGENREKYLATTFAPSGHLKKVMPSIEGPSKKTTYKRSKEDKKKMQRLVQSKNMWKAKYTTMREKHENLQKQNILLRKKVKQKQIKVEGLNIMVRKMKTQTQKLQHEKSKKTQTNAVLRDKVHHLENVIEQLKGLEEENNINMKKIADQNQDILEMRTSIDYLEQVLQDAPTRDLHLWQENRFSDATDICILELLGENVGMNHISNVIAIVASLCGKDNVDRFPSVSHIREVNLRALEVAKQQVSEVLVPEENTTLYSDETTKKGHKFTGYHVSDREGGLYMLGLREMSNKSAQTTLDTFREILDDLDRANDERARTGLQPSVGKQILANIKNTMSDQAATCKAFNELLQRYRLSILPDVCTDWARLSQAEQAAHGKMYNFFCGLHLLVNLAESANKCIVKFEQECDASTQGAAGRPDTASFTKSTESGMVRLVRTACKAFARGADEKNGCWRDFNTHMMDRYNIKPKLVPFRGNRFNVVFLDAALVFHYSEKARDFLEQVHGTPNLLLRALLSDLKTPLYIAGARAMGLLDKLVTSPLWRIIERKGHILEMNQNYTTLKDFFTRTAIDATPLLNGESPFPNEVKCPDVVLTHLLEESDSDLSTKQILQYVMTAWATYIAKAMSDHLPGGKFAGEVSTEVKEETASALKHNKFPERVFALLDHLVKVRPNASTLTNEAHMMFTLNKTGEWLKAKTPEDQSRVLDKARRESRVTQVKFRERLVEIERENAAKLKSKQEAIERKRQKDLKEKAALTSDIIYYGLWQRVSEVDSALEEITSDVEKRKALAAQLKFRKRVLQQEVSDASVFNTTRKDNKDITLHQLVTNVKKVITSAYGIEEATGTSGNKSGELRQLGQPLLVGKKIRHKFTTAEGAEWFRGYVISTVPGFRDWYNIKYDNDPAIYTYNYPDLLLADYQSGDLVIEPGQ